MLRTIIIASPFLFLGCLHSVSAQNAVDAQTLGKADALMAEIKAADANDIPVLVSRFNALGQTDGLSQPCRKALVSMQKMAAMTVPDEDMEDVPEDMRGMLQTQAAADQGQIDADRAACLHASASQAREPVASAPALETPTQVVAPAIQNAANKVIEKDTPRWHLDRLRTRIKDAFEAGNAEGVEALQSLLFVRTRVKEKNPHCDFAETAMMKETKSYLDVLNAADPEAKKKFMTNALAAGKAVDSALEKCD